MKDDLPAKPGHLRENKPLSVKKMDDEATRISEKIRNRTRNKGYNGRKVEPKATAPALNWVSKK